MKKIIILSTVLLLLLLSSCTSTSNLTKGDAFPLMYEEDPTVVLIMPPINYSTNVEAKDFFYTTMNVPIADAGYYVLPPNMTLAYLQKESAYDSELFLEGDISKFKDLLGADVVVFTVIKKWDKLYSGVQGTVNISVEYIIRSTKTGEVLYSRDALINYYIASNKGGSSIFGLLANILTTTLETATTDYIEVAVDCNDTALVDLPSGIYSPYHQIDQDDPALLYSIHKQVKKK